MGHVPHTGEKKNVARKKRIGKSEGERPHRIARSRW
jgi:hypothetical protein